MKPLRFSLLVLFLLLVQPFSPGLAQDYKGYTSFVDLVYTEAYSRPLEKFAECAAAAPDAVTVLECVHNLEIIDSEAFRRCEAHELGTCNERFGYPTPFYPKTYGDMVTDVYDEIYERYYSNVYDYAVQELMPCIAVWCYFDGGSCIAEAVANIIRHAYGSLNTVYWEEIFEASLYYLDTTLWYQLPFPSYGGIVLPIFTDEENLGQYVQYAQSINEGDDQGRGYPYSRTSPAFPNQLVPYEADETQRGFPGLYAFEALKRELTVGTLLEDMQYGFSTVLEFHGGTELMLVEPLPCIFVLALPGIRRAFIRQDSIGEGYQIPYSSDTPWVPLAQPTSVSELISQLPLINEEPPVTSSTPLSVVLSCSPLTLDDLAQIDVLDTKKKEQEPTLSLGGGGPFVTATQYLLRANLLERYGNEQERATLTSQLGSDTFPELEVTGVFDTETSEALGFIQGKENLPITRSLDVGTLSELGSSNCKGSQGETVMGLQSALQGAGFDVDLTGAFDEATEAAVKSVQEQAGLPVTGMTDTNTWLALFTGQ